jgi:hypothetical protein
MLLWWQYRMVGWVMRGPRNQGCAADAKRAVHAHERAMHKGKPLTRLGKKGGDRK